MKKKRIIAILVTFAILMALVPSMSIQAQAATTNFDKLVNHINSRGSVYADGNMIIVEKLTSGSYDFFFAIKNVSSGVYFQLLTSSSKGDRISSNLEFVLSRSSKNITVNFLEALYLSGRCVDSVNSSKTIAVADYDSAITYSISGSGRYITNSDYKKNFNSNLGLLCKHWDQYLYNNLGFGLKGLGFKSYDGLGRIECLNHTYDNVCDAYCNACGAERTAGHTYDNACDTTCNICGRVREAQHSYDHGCDATCNICGATRITSHSYSHSCDATCNNCGTSRPVVHSYDNNCDTTCNVCGSVRATNHVYTSSCDGVCNICGFERTTSNHTYSNKQDTTCDVCGYVRVIVPEDNSATVYSGTCGSNAKWRITKNGTLIISGSGNMYSYAYDTQPWGDYSVRKQIKNVIIEPGITSIGNYAFYFCTQMESAWIPESVTIIGEDCFSNCESLRSVKLPEGIRTIPNFAFAYCSSLEEIYIPTTVQSFGQGCFQGCSSLRYFIIPDGVRKVAHGMFWGCSSMEYVQIPSSVMEIDTFGFYECGNLRDVYYGGTRSQYSAIEIDSLNKYNNGLLYATIHYSSKAPCVNCVFGSYSRTDENYHSRVCTNCGKAEKAPHSWDVGSITKKPTCAETGLKVFTCAVCGEQKTQTLAETDSHTYSAWSSQNTSTHKRTCTLCGKADTASHTWNSGTITKQPTCKTEGIKTYTCTVCNGTKTEAIPTTDAHSYGKWGSLNTNSHQRTCTLCGKADTASHTWNSGTITKQPTCKETGIKTYTCTACNGTKTETIAKTTTHTYGVGTKVNESVHKHSCSVCGKETLANHSWDAGTVTVQPTLDATGVKEYKCTGCDAVKTEVLPKRASGDMNGDQKVNDADVEYLLWHTLFPNKYPLEVFADFDGNGTVNDKDVEYLLWHTLFPDKYPLQVK